MNYIDKFQSKYDKSIKEIHNIKYYSFSEDEVENERQKKEAYAKCLMELATLKSDYNRLKEIYESGKNEFGIEISTKTRDNLKSFIDEFSHFDDKNSAINKIITDNIYDCTITDINCANDKTLTLANIGFNTLSEEEKSEINNQNLSKNEKVKEFLDKAPEEEIIKYQNDIDSYNKRSINYICNLNEFDSSIEEAEKEYANVVAASRKKTKKRVFKYIATAAVIVSGLFVGLPKIKSFINTDNRPTIGKTIDNSENSDENKNTNQDKANTNTTKSNSNSNVNTNEKSENNSTNIDSNKTSNLNNEKGNVNSNSTNATINKSSSNSKENSLNSSSNNKTNQVSQNNSTPSNSSSTTSNNTSTVTTNITNGIDLSEDARNNANIIEEKTNPGTSIPKDDNVNGDNQEVVNDVNKTKHEDKVNPSVNDKDKEDTSSVSDNKTTIIPKDDEIIEDETDVININPILPTHEDKINESVNDKDKYDTVVEETKDTIIPSKIVDDDDDDIEYFFDPFNTTTETKVEDNDKKDTIIENKTEINVVDIIEIEEDTKKEEIKNVDSYNINDIFNDLTDTVVEDNFVDYGDMSNYIVDDDVMTLTLK